MGQRGVGFVPVFLLFLLLPVPVSVSEGPRGGLRLCRRLLWETRELAERYVRRRRKGGGGVRVSVGASVRLSCVPSPPLTGVPHPGAGGGAVGRGPAPSFGSSRAPLSGQHPRPGLDGADGTGGRGWRGSL